ncbi:MAG: glycosyltransferase family 2 protein [Longimicrobiaceae bacterium]
MRLNADPANGGPGISLVVPTHDDARYLAALLESVDRARGGMTVEVVVVDDSSPADAAAVAALCERHGAVLERVRGGPAAKRNRGAARARHDLVLFVDADCEVAPDTLRHHAALAGMEPGVGARVGLVEFPGEPSAAWDVVERTQFLGAFRMAARMPRAPWGVSCNLCVRREAFVAVGGFDEALLPVAGGEDVDLGLRLNAAGWVIACAPEAVVRHTRDTWTGARRVARRGWRYGRGHFHLLRKHRAATSVEFPRLPAAFALALAACAVRAALAGRPAALLAGPAFVAAAMGVQALAVTIQQGRPLGTVHRELAAHLLDLSFDAGVIAESLRQRSLEGVWRKLVYARGQLVAERPRKVIQSWSLAVALAVLVLAF